jgi:hypothetical protein
MTRTAALRASILFLAFTLLSALLGLQSHSPAAEALFLITGPLAVLMLLFGLAGPVQAPALARARTRRSRR